MSDVVFSLVIIASIPLLTSVLLYIIYRSKRFEAVPDLKKQIIAGIIFGLLAVLATEKGDKLIQVVPEEMSSAVTTGKWERALYKMSQIKLALSGLLS